MSDDFLSNCDKLLKALAGRDKMTIEEVAKHLSVPHDSAIGIMNQLRLDQFARGCTTDPIWISPEGRANIDHYGEMLYKGKWSFFNIKTTAITAWIALAISIAALIISICK